MPHKAMVNRLRAEYLEMPGLRLTREQAQRLCSVDSKECQRALDTLVESHFLCVKPDGAYARLIDGAEPPRPHAAKADLTRHPRSRTAS